MTSKNLRGRRTNTIKANMEVTRENFQTVLSSLPEVFRNAQFIAIDTEFTGLRVEGADNINYFDTLEDIYLKNRQKAETFMAVQIGVVPFFYDAEANKFSHLGYNFYVYPSSYSDVNFTCQSTTIQFLIEHGFDFNKLFKDGIPYLKDKEVETLIEKLTEKYEKNYSFENATIMEIPDEHKPTVNNIISKIDDILKANKKTSFTTERFNRYVRKLIYNSVQQKFGSSVSIESNKDDSVTISIGFSTQEIKEKQKEKFVMQKKEILNEVGFNKVIKLLIESQKLLVGHNLLLDILFIIKQFLVPLPNSYIEFKELIMFLFPNIIDTKYMATAEVLNIKSTCLNCLVEFFKNIKAFPEVPVHADGVGYNINDEKLHEASYDAYLTGLCFLTMAEKLGKDNITSDIFKNLTKSSVLQPILNKISIPKLQDIPYMNLGGLDKEPDRLGVYHLTFPKEWTRENITDLFKTCGFINISWINSTSAFVKVKKEYIDKVEKNLMNPNQNYKLLTHSKFKSLKSPSADLLSPILAKKLGTDNKNPLSTNSPITANSNDLGKKRKIEEDIGEVIERPQKKRYSK